MVGLLLIWLEFLAYYLGAVVWPTNLNNCSRKTLDKQEIDDDSILRYIYINKKAHPKLKIIAYETIVNFLLNVIVSIIIFALFLNGFESKLLNIISLIYFLTFMFVETLTIIILNVKK